MNKRLIVDGFNMAFRAHFAYKDSVTSTGVPSGCVYGFLVMLKAIKEKYSDCEIFIAWDSYAKRKKDLYPEYKANRNKLAEDPPIQSLKNALSCLAVTQVDAINEEADDVIATLAQDFDGLVYIYSSDKDLLQLVRDGKIILIRPVAGGAKKIYDEEAVLKEFGVTPHDLACYLAFRGDTSDNIPGVPRLPSKVITSLVGKYHEPGEVYAKLASENLTDFQRKGLLDSEKQVSLNYILAKLVTDLECSYTRGLPNSAMLADILNLYEIKRLNSQDLVDLFNQTTSFLVRTSPSHEKVQSYSLADELDT